jgi:dihydrofolate synthase/folylpolyglutamate synthase
MPRPPLRSPTLNSERDDSVPTGFFNSYDDAMFFLHSRIDYERAAAEKMTARDFKLDRMAELLARLGNPQETIPAVHITGTKGKGSTAVMTAEMLSAAGYRTGLFTSPHVSTFEERMRVDGRMPSREECTGLLDEVAAEVMQLDLQGPAMRPTYFEIATAMAWLYFRRCRCDYVVLEVGLGGRLDSTNLCRPEVTVITNVSRDHMHVLGNTAREIAAEKAGIIKPHIPVVCGVERPDAAGVIHSTARRCESPLYQSGRDYDAVYRRADDGTRKTEGVTRNAGEPVRPPSSDLRPPTVDVQTPFSRFTSLPLPLRGEHQARNAAAAVTAIDVLRNRGFRISDAAVTAGMANVLWPLRLEVLRRSPIVIADAAHNEASAAALVAALRSEFPAERRILIFAASQDKDVEAIAANLFPAFDTVVATQFIGNPRSIPPGELAERVGASYGGRLLTAANPLEAYALALEMSAAGDLICASGSFYLAAEVRNAVLGLPLPVEVPTAIRVG